MTLSDELNGLAEAAVTYQSKTGHTLPGTLNGQKITFLFRKVHGIPEAGHLTMDLEFTVGEDRYHYTFDGHHGKAQKNGQPFAENQPVEGLGSPLEDVASSILELYVHSIAPADVARDYLDVTGWELDQSGALVPM